MHPELRLYEDVLPNGGEAALPALPRMIFVVHGSLAVADHTLNDGEAWSGGEYNDRIQRLDPRTGQFTEYLLPRETNVRRVFVDNSDWRHGRTSCRAKNFQRNL